MKLGMFLKIYFCREAENLYGNFQEKEFRTRKKKTRQQATSPAALGKGNST